MGALRGQLEELRVWAGDTRAAALTRQVIKAYSSLTGAMITAIHPHRAHLVGYYRLDQSSGDTATDYSGLGWTMKLFNGPAWVTGLPTHDVHVHDVAATAALDVGLVRLREAQLPTEWSVYRPTLSIYITNATAATSQAAEPITQSPSRRV